MSASTSIDESGRDLIVEFLLQEGKLAEKDRADAQQQDEQHEVVENPVANRLPEGVARDRGDAAA